MSINEEDVKTYGLGQQQTEGNATTGALEPMMPEMNSAPPLAAPPPANDGAPLPGDATGAPDGGAEPVPKQDDPLLKDRGTPADAAKNLGAQAVDVGGQVLKEIKAARANANPLERRKFDGHLAQTEEILNATGASVKEAGKQLNEDVEKGIRIQEINGDISPKEAKKKLFAWKNVYDKIAPEEMGLFLIDFGMRAMMAGESMGTLGALGAAGTGAMGALSERRAANEATAVEDYKYSREQDQKERELQIRSREKPPTLTETVDGFVYWDETLNNGAGGWAEAMVGNKKVVPPLSSASRPFAPAALAEQLKQSGFFSEQDIAILAAKQPGRGEIQKDAMDSWERRLADNTYPTNPATGRNYTSTQWKAVPTLEQEKYRSEYTDRYVQEYLSVYEENKSQISDEEAAAAAQNALRMTN